MPRDIKRFNIDVMMASRACGTNNVFWPQDMSWIRINNYELPSNFRERYTNILILIPENYGYGGCFRDIFINPDLELLDRDGKTYRKMDSDIHGFREIPYFSVSPDFKSLLADRNWFYLCLHDKDPKSSIVNYLYKIRLFLSNPYKDWSAIESH